MIANFSHVPFIPLMLAIHKYGGKKKMQVLAVPLIFKIAK